MTEPSQAFEQLPKALFRSTMRQLQQQLDDLVITVWSGPVTLDRTSQADSSARSSFG
jgi:hypothetical protein